MAAVEDYHFMARALQLARRGRSTTDPNPRVGCVVVCDGALVGEGWHERAGEPHAERHALQQAGTRAAGASVYLTLEPCVHQGRTPPCAAALIEAGVARVVCATEDPNPQVAGRGLAQLKDAGIAVEVGVAREAAEKLNPGFNKRMLQGMPWIRLKLAVSLDGRTGLANGASRWITSAAARADVHRWRARSSAVLSGIGTVLADDPGLNPRLPAGEATFLEPLRVILDSQLRLPVRAKTLTLPGRVLVFTRNADSQAQGALVERGAEVVCLAGSGPLPLDQVLRQLAAREINEVWVEAGARLNGAFMRQGLVDELLVYLAPHILGNKSRGMFCLDEFTDMGERLQLEWLDTRRIGEDLRLRLRPRIDRSGVS